MQKKKALIFIAIAAAILTYFLLGFLAQKRTEYIAKKECYKHTDSYHGGIYTYPIPQGIDCSAYIIELDAAFPGSDNVR